MKLPIKNIINYYRSARTIYNIHSPFVFDFVNEVYDTSRRYYVFDRIESLRFQLLRSDEVMNFQDYGTGHNGSSQYEIPVKEVAGRSLSGKEQCRILFNLVNHYKPGRVLELGTSLGIATAYLAAPSSHTSVYTLEGNPSSLRLARRAWKRLGLDNITGIEGAFEVTLPEVLEKMKVVDLCFIDGNHRYEATIKYYEAVMRYTQESSIIIIDDIYWSKEMHAAWQELSSRPEVTLAIDLYHCGLLFFNPAIKEKQVISLIPYRFKPYSIGVFG